MTKYTTISDIGEIKENYLYDPLDGTILNKITGNIIGSKCGNARSTVTVNCESGRKILKLHRLAYYLMTGNDANGDIDHIDGNPHNNRWINLRVVTKAQNMKNRKIAKSNKSGYIGVMRTHPMSKTYMYQLRCDGIRYRKQGFKSAEEASDEREMLAVKLFGEFYRGTHKGDKYEQ